MVNYQKKFLLTVLIFVLRINQLPAFSFKSVNRYQGSKVISKKICLHHLHCIAPDHRSKAGRGMIRMEAIPNEARRDRVYMARALELAKKGLGRTFPNPCVGCVLVKDDAIIGEGFHPRAGMPHAEV